MKKSYKLLGLFWDRKPEASAVYELDAYDPDYLAITEQPSLFDLVEKKRRITLTELLNVNTHQAFETIIEKLKGCNSVAIVNDCHPRSRSRIHRDFFLHRLLQVIEALSSKLPESKVMLMPPWGEYNQICFLDLLM